MNFIKSILIAVFVAVVLVSSGVFFIVDETQQAIVFQFQDPKNVIQKAGLHMKLPFIQNTVFLDKKLLEYYLPPEKITGGDKKFAFVDTFTLYRITDPLMYYQAMETEKKAQDRLKSIIIDAMRSVVGKYVLNDLLSEKRTDIMKQIYEIVNKGAKKFGINVVDVRIKRADFPKENYGSIFDRMRSERDREAKELRAIGTEKAQNIRSQAEKERTVLLANAQKEAQILKGEGEAQALKIISEATKRNPKFYSIYKSYETYQSTFDSGNSTFILSPKGGFFEHFN